MPELPADLPVGPLRDLLAWWRSARVKGLIIGGLAVAFRGQPRTTRDVDAIVFVRANRWPTFLEKGEGFSFRSRIPDPLVFADTYRIFLMHHRCSNVDVDLSLGALPFETEALQRAQKVKIGRLSIPIPTAEDLIVLKAVANRPRDWIDIEGILNQSDQLDTEYIRRHVDTLASDIENPELYYRLDRRLQEHSRSARRRNR